MCFLNCFQTRKSLPFKAEFVPASDHFSVFPPSGEILPESEEGTLFKVGFTSPSYGKIYQTHLVITVIYSMYRILFFSKI